jgi:hypothetical protein
MSGRTHAPSNTRAPHTTSRCFLARPLLHYPHTSSPRAALQRMQAMTVPTMPPTSHTTLPRTSARGTGPYSLESLDSVRLSPCWAGRGVSRDQCTRRVLGSMPCSVQCSTASIVIAHCSVRRLAHQPMSFYHVLPGMQCAGTICRAQRAAPTSCNANRQHLPVHSHAVLHSCARRPLASHAPPAARCGLGAPSALLVPGCLPCRSSPLNQARLGVGRGKRVSGVRQAVGSMSEQQGCACVTH